MNIKQYLPSTIFTKRLGALVVIVLLSILLYKVLPKIGLLFKKKPINPEQASILASIDTDNDGVYDWQEKLWGTDPNNKNTFGINDADYVANKQTELDTTDSQSENNTDILSKQLFATINAIKADGTLNQEDAYVEIAKSVAEFVTDNPTNNAQKITKTNITTVPNTPANKKAYTKSIGNLSTIFFGKNSVIGSETSIIYYALVNEDPTHLQDLDAVIEDYEKLAVTMTNIKTPEAISADQTQLVNTLYQVSNSLTEAKSLFSDTVVGIRGVVEYNKAMTELDSIIDSLQTYASN